MVMLLMLMLLMVTRERLTKLKTAGRHPECAEKKNEETGEFKKVRLSNSLVNMP